MNLGILVESSEQGIRHLNVRGVATRICLGGRIHGHPNPPPQKIWFLLGLWPLYFENVVKCKIVIRVKKKIQKYHNFWGWTSPADFLAAGDAYPVPPLSTPMLNINFCYADTFSPLLLYSDCTSSSSAQPFATPLVRHSATAVCTCFYVGKRDSLLT